MSDELAEVLAEAWEASGFLVHIKGEAMRDICECFNNVFDGQDDWQHCFARARVIAAAPELYRALDTLLSSIAEGIPPDALEIDAAEDVLDALRDAS